MKNICFLISNLNNSGGTERVCSIIANRLDNCGYNIQIASIIDGSQPFFELNDGIKVSTLVTSGGRVLYKTSSIIKALRKVLIAEDIDILIVVDTMSILFTLPATHNLSIKHICWEHFNFKNDNGRYGRRIARHLAARYCDHIVTLTEQDKIFWLKNTKHKYQISSIPNPSPFIPRIVQTTKPRNKTVLAVGRLTPVKGFDLLIKSWKILSKRVPEWKLVIVGEGEQRHQLQNMIDCLDLNDSVKLVGNVKNIEDYYINAELFCLSSKFEGFPMALLEAISFGLPVVSFDCYTGPAEILDGTDSILVPNGNTKILAESLLKLMQDECLRKTISIKCIKKAKDYQPEAIIARWIDLIQS